MHIEPGVVDGAKIALSYATAAGGFAMAGKLAHNDVRNNGGVAPLVLRSLIATALVFSFTLSSARRCFCCSAPVPPPSVWPPAC